MKTLIMDTQSPNQPFNPEVSSYQRSDFVADEGLTPDGRLFYRRLKPHLWTQLHNNQTLLGKLADRHLLPPVHLEQVNDDQLAFMPPVNGYY